MKISLIVATDLNNAIGKDNSLLWHLPADMKFFREKTMGHTVITGRKNYESIPEKFRPLPGRKNIVITRQSGYLAPGAIVASSVEEAIKVAKNANEDCVFIIGGGEIYQQTISLADEIYRTLVYTKKDADTFFPEIDLKTYKKVWEESHTKDEKNPYDYTFEKFVRC